MKYKRSVVLVALALTMALVPVTLAQAKKPLKWDVSGYLTSYGWAGTVDSGPLAGKAMYWYTRVLEIRGQRVYFFEEWEIKDGETVIIAGYDFGATRFMNGKFTGNGKVTYAIAPYTHLIGLKEQLSGTADFMPTPWTFTGTVQIN